MKTKPIVSTLLAVCFTCATLHAEDGKIIPAEFASLGKATAEMVASIKPDATPLSEEDQNLFTMIAEGGMMQLEAGKLAVKMAATADVRVIAQAEVEEQTGLGKKIKEIAAAKKATIPPGLSEKSQKELADLATKDGENFDTHYIKESGITGHKMLKSTMEKVKDQATDLDLKKLAEVTLPLVELHLKVAMAESKEG